MAPLSIVATSSHNINQVTVEDGDEAVASLVQAGSNLKGTVDCLVECHSSASPTNAEFRELRTRLTHAVFLYRDLHLPLSTKLVNSLANLMALYDAMDVHIFCQNIHVVAQEVKHRADHASTVIHVHVALLTDLNELKLDADSTLDTLSLESKARIAQAEAFDREGEAIHKKEKHDGKIMAGAAALWAADAAFFTGIPIVSGIYVAGASLLTAKSAIKIQKAKDDLAQYKLLSAAESEEAEMAMKAAEIIRDPLSAAVKSFIQGIEKVAGFLKKLEGDVSNYAENASTMEVNKATIALYLNVVKSQSAKIQQACGNYLAIMPAIEGRMAALSGIGTSDPNYVQKWLALKFPEQNLATFYKLLA